MCLCQCSEQSTDGEVHRYDYHWTPSRYWLEFLDSHGAVSNISRDLVTRIYIIACSLLT